MFSNDQNIETIAQLVEVLKHYIGLKSDLFRLDVTEKIVRLFTVMTMTVVLSFLLVLVLIYLSFGFAHVLGHLIGITAAFFAVAGFYFLVFILCILYRKRWIERPLVRFLASILIDK